MLQRAAHRFFQAEKVAAWMLPREVSIARIEEDALFAAGVIDHAGRQFCPRCVAALEQLVEREGIEPAYSDAHAVTVS